MHVLSRSPILPAILSTILIRHTHCLPTTNLLPVHAIYSLPPLQPNIPLNASSNGNCASRANYPSWSSPDWVVEDCYTARQQLYVREVLARPNIAYEFLAQGLSPRQHPLGQRTPRKYIVGTCVLTIMMLNWFQPGELPAGKGFTRADRDFSTYRDIWNAATSIETECTVSKSPGWLMTGKDSAMGVFVWSKNSHINEITGGFPVESLGMNDSDILILHGVRRS